MTAPNEPNHDGIGWALAIGIFLGWIYGAIYFAQINRLWVWLLRERP